MTTTTVPAVPANAFRVTLDLAYGESRMDNVLLVALRNQDENITLKNLSRSGLKSLFSKKKIMIKGQRAKSSSALV